MVNKPRVFFRADGNPQMGFGHIYRSLALAGMISNDFECHFITRNSSSSLSIEIKKICKSVFFVDNIEENVEEANRVLDLLLPSDIVVLDGYHFTTEYQSVFKSYGCRVVCIDDIMAYPFVGDAVINHAPGIERRNYNGNINTLFLFGLNYALLRKPFSKSLLEKKRPLMENGTLFICFGGSDYNNLTYKLISSINENPIDGLKKVVIVIGATNKYKEILTTLSEERLSYNIEVNSNLDAYEMKSKMQSCSLAVVPSSGILFECLASGIPSISGYYVDNQQEVFKGFNDLNLIYPAHDLNDIESLRNIIQDNIRVNHGQLVNRIEEIGIQDSAKNLLKIFQFLSKCSKTEIINNNESHINDYFRWANDKEVRNNSISTEVISFDNHVIWYNRKVNDENCKMYLIKNQNNLIGQIRFDIEDEIALIDYSIDNAWRAKGYGKVIMHLGLERLLLEVESIKSIKAQVRKENIASCKVFEFYDFERKMDNDYCFYQKKVI